MKRFLTLVVTVAMILTLCSCTPEQSNISYSTNIKFTDEELGGLKLPLAEGNPKLSMIAIGDNNYNELPAIKSTVYTDILSFIED